MIAELSDAAIEQIAQALGGRARAAYTTPIVYPWSVQHFAARPMAERPHQITDRFRLYVHIPFCNYHCTFCFYAVRAGAKRAEMERYTEALVRELEWVAPGTRLSELIVGGGTPTALPPDLLERVLAAIFARVTATCDRPSTIEASPDSLTEVHLDVLKANGIGRVSIGVESLDPSVLRTVHRRHTPDQALAACRMVADSGLVLNADLVYGLPSQTPDSFRRDLDAVVDAGARSLSLYALRLNENTPVAAQLRTDERLDLAHLMRWRAFVTRCADEVGFDQTRCYTFVRRNGGRRAETSLATKQPGLFTELGIGMSARSQLGDAVYRNHDRNEIYMQRVEQNHSPVESVFDMDARDRKTQFIAASLGNGKPLDRAGYAQRFGAAIDADFGALLERLRAADLIADDNAQIVLTALGRLVYDRVVLCFYPKRTQTWLHQWDTPPRLAAARQSPGS